MNATNTHTPGLHNFPPKVRAMIETAPEWAQAAAMTACRGMTQATPRPKVAETVTMAVLAKAEADRAALLAALLEVKRLRDLWRSQDDAVSIDSIAYMDGLDRIDVDAVIAGAGGS